MAIEARPTIPELREQTIRRDLLRCLEVTDGLTARDISAVLGIPERSVPDHLEHLQKSLRGQHLDLVMIPAECRDCGFVFHKRTRFTRPGRCPVCRSTHLSEPRFRVG